MVIKSIVSSCCIGATILACGSGAGLSSVRPEALDAATLDGSDGSIEDAGDEAAVPYETVGAYRCCAEGTGVGCCGGTPQGTCFKYGGAYGACRQAGEQIEGKIICARCCDGLQAVSQLVPGNQFPPAVDGLPDGCDLSPAPESLLVCVRCGDGICGPGENSCICPSDCPK
jgi:hypothetical protein